MVKKELPLLDEIRRAIISALFSDDELFERLALKGGNALRLVYNLQARTSLDIDVSLDTELGDLGVVLSRLVRALHDRLEGLGYVSFDEKLNARPPGATGRWGGYLLEFKVISRLDYGRLGDDLSGLRRNAVAFGAQQRTWQVEISKYEHCEGKQAFELNAQTIYVYSPAMIVIEKLRALCQQLPEYPHRGHRTPRARDFYDIHSVVTQLSPELESAERVALARAIFKAKDVPLSLLGKIRSTHDFHAVDWPSVQVASGSGLQAFGFYFEFVAAQAERLEALWEE